MTETIHIHNYAGSGGPVELDPGHKILRFVPQIDSPAWGFPQDVDGTFPSIDLKAGKVYVIYEVEAD